MDENNDDYNTTSDSDLSFTDGETMGVKEIAMRKIEFALADFEEQQKTGKKTLILRTSFDVSHHQIRYHSNNRQKMARDLQLLRQIHDLLANNKRSTKRELFYEFKAIYVQQRNLDSSITSICELLDEKRENLNINASGRGFLRGAITFLTEEVGIVDARVQTVLVEDSLCQCDVISEAQFILVVEKDTIFQKLLDEQFQYIFPRGILVTARGYPDIATRNVVRKIAEKKQLPVFGLFDADPHGIEIYLTYKYGKLHQKAEGRGALVPSLQWIGLYASDFSKYPISPAQRLPLKFTDISKIRKLIPRSIVLAEHTVTRELDWMLQNKWKLEIESIILCGHQFLARHLIAPRITVERDEFSAVFVKPAGNLNFSEHVIENPPLKWSELPKNDEEPEDYNSDASDDEMIAEILEEVNGYSQSII